MAVLGGATGGGSNAFPKVVFFGSSNTYTPTISVTALVHVFGGGGSGGSAAASTSYKTASSGGGAGEHACVKMTLSAGTTYTITAGAGGAGHANHTVGNTPNQGNAGGNSSFTASGISISANGGAAGACTQNQNNGDQITASGGAGGTGGSSSGVTDLFRFAGGRGGNASVTGAPNSVAVTGGGAVGITGTGIRAADVTIASAVSGSGRQSAGASTGTQESDISVSGGAMVYSTAETKTLMLLNTSMDLRQRPIGLYPHSSLTDSEKELLLLTPCTTEGIVPAPGTLNINDTGSVTGNAAGQGYASPLSANSAYIYTITAGRFAGAGGAMAGNYYYYNGGGGAFGGGGGGMGQATNTSGYNTQYPTQGGGHGGVIIEILGVA